MKNGRSRLWIALVLAVVAFLAVNLAAGLTLGSARIDFTQARIYTLSPVTTDILKGLKEPVHIRFYVSPAMVEVSGRYANYAEHVRELLGVYARRSHGMVTVETISPEPYSPEEDRAFGFGLRGVPVDNSGGQAYFGIVGTNSTDQTQTIPFLTPERETFLEYDLTRLISTLATPKKTIIGLIDGAGTSGPGWAAVDEVRQSFTVRMIEPNTTAIDPTVSVLMIIHPHDLAPSAQFAIDQFVMGGGRVLAFVDPDAEGLAPSAADMMGGAPATSSDMPVLFKSWGIAYDPAKVAADWQQAMRIQAESFGREVVTEFPPYIGDKPPYVKADDPVTGDLKVVNLITPGALSQIPGAKTVFTSLIQTSPDAALADVADCAAAADPLAFVSKYHPTSGPGYTLAARITGDLSSAFPNGPPKDTHTTGPVLKQTAKPAEIIVAADVDILSDHSWVEMRNLGGQHVAIPFASNGDFVINALESLTGQPGLSSLRARGVASRPLTKLEDVERAADAQYEQTEEDLSQKLEDVQRKLLTLSGSQGKQDSKGGAPLLNEQQMDAVKQFRAEMSDTRNQLRDVQHNLRHDLDRLETRIRIVNIAVMPLAVIIFAGLLAVHARRRR
jgi:ABC-type uncharacterized transport system involved in gliding motility auxiliary subunit